jgi:ribosome-associated protein
VAGITVDEKGTSQQQEDRSLQLALAAAQTAEDNRATDVVVLDMRELTPMFDYFVLATGKSRKQLHAISEEIDHKLEDELSDHRMGLEGYANSRWILLDYGTVVIHIFDAETRDYYLLDELWSQAKRVERPKQANDAPVTPK